VANVVATLRFSPAMFLPHAEAVEVSLIGESFDRTSEPVAGQAEPHMP
jgi:hypothetical protein